MTLSKRSKAAKKGWHTRRANLLIATGILQQLSRMHGVDYSRIKIWKRANLNLLVESNGDVKTLAARTMDEEGNLFDESYHNPFWYHKAGK